MCWLSGYHVQSYGVSGCTPDRCFLHGITESYNILNWKRPTRIIQSNSRLLTGLPKTKPCNTILLYYFRQKVAVTGTYWKTSVSLRSSMMQKTSFAGGGSTHSHWGLTEQTVPAAAAHCSCKHKQKQSTPQDLTVHPASWKLLFLYKLSTLLSA